MIIRPFVREYFVYIDDGGLEEINAPGYTFLLADSFTAQAIRKHVDGVKSSYKMARLHANEIGRDNYRIYKDVYGEIFPTVIQ